MLLWPKSLTVIFIASLFSDVGATLQDVTKKDLSEESSVALGCGLTIKKFDRIKAETEPSKFETNLAQSLWTTEALANRCVRSQSNVFVKQLEDDKKGVLEKHFKEWLTNEGYLMRRIAYEMEKVNKYMNSAITGARKKLKRSKELFRSIHARE